MQQTITHCVWCDTKLHANRSWQGLWVKEQIATICESCLQQFEVFTQPQEACFIYNEIASEWLQRYKIQKDLLLATSFTQQLRHRLLKERAIIVPVPLHPLKLQERTFAQVEQLLIAAALPYEEHLLKKDNITQGLGSRAERLQRENPFVLRDRTAVLNRDFVIFDDVCTTGATLQHIVMLFKEAGARKVTTFTLFRSEFTRMMYNK